MFIFLEGNKQFSVLFFRSMYVVVIAALKATKAKANNEFSVQNTYKHLLFQQARNEYTFINNVKKNKQIYDKQLS